MHFQLAICLFIAMVSGYILIKKKSNLSAPFFYTSFFKNIYGILLSIDSSSLHLFTMGYNRNFHDYFNKSTLV